MEWLPHWLAGPEAGLAGLFVASFLAATLLPGGSEAVLFALVRLHPEQAVPAVVLATVGNTLGGMTTYWVGRVLLLAWAPVVGDALCAAAGWLRLPWFASALWMAAGKAARYVGVFWLAASI